jgi:hypothetical protein
VHALDRSAVSLYKNRESLEYGIPIGPNTFYVSQTLNHSAEHYYLWILSSHLECDPILSHSKGRGLDPAVLTIIKHERTLLVEMG